MSQNENNHMFLMLMLSYNIDIYIILPYFGNNEINKNKIK